MTLQRYVLKQLLLALVFAGGGILFVLLPAILVNAVHKVGSAGLIALAHYLPLVLADLVPYILPLGFLLAVVTTFGRMAADREWTAVRMAGIHPGRLLVPGLLVAAGLAAGTHWIASDLAPGWKYSQRSYKREVLANAIKRLAPGRTEIRIPGFFLTAARRDPGRPVFFDTHISILQDGGEEGGRDLWVYADRVSFALQGDILRVGLTNPRVIKGEMELLGAEASYTLDLEQLLKPSRADPDRAKYLPSDEMRRRIDAGEVEGEERGEYVYEIHRRHALGATYLLFLLLGFPTGILLRSGTQLAAFAAAVAYAIAYYVLSLRMGQQLFASGLLPAWAAPWITNVVGCAAGAVATWKVIRK